MSEYTPKSLEWCVGCSQDYCVDCVQTALTNSNEGQLLRNNEPRYSMFMWEDQQRFKQYMGHDVVPELHGTYQAMAVAMPFIEHQNASHHYQSFGREEAKMLIIGNVLHDSHEGIVGDVPVPDKTIDTDRLEQSVNLECVRQILQPTDEFLKDYESVVWDLEGWSFAGRAFSAIEKCGYFLTGVRAWELRNHADLDDDEREKCEAMGRQVIKWNFEPLLNLSNEFSYAGFLLDANEQAVAEAYE